MKPLRQRFVQTMNTPAFVVEREAHLAIYTYIRSASRFPLYPMTIRLPDKGDYAHCYFAMPAQRIIPHTQKERFTITFRPIHRERAESVRIVRKCSQSTTIHHHANSNAIPSQPNNLNSYITPIHTHTPTPSHPNGAHNKTKAHLIRLIPHSAVHGTRYIYVPVAPSKKTQRRLRCALMPIRLHRRGIYIYFISQYICTMYSPLVSVQFE